MMIMCLLPFLGMQAQDSLQQNVANPDGSVECSLSTNSANIYADSLYNECLHFQQKQEAYDYIFAVISVFVLLLLVFVIVLAIRINHINRKRKLLKDDFCRFKANPLQQTHLDYITKVILDEVDRRIMLMNRNHTPLKEETNIKPMVKQPETVTANTPVIRYFGTNSGSFFVQAYNEQNPTTAFKVVFRDKTMQEGEFSLLDLNKIKSSDSISQVVEFMEGSQKLDVARDAIMKQVGKVVKSGNSWKVETKLKLILY